MLSHLENTLCDYVKLCLGQDWEAIKTTDRLDLGEISFLKWVELNFKTIDQQYFDDMGNGEREIWVYFTVYVKVDLPIDFPDNLCLEAADELKSGFNDTKRVWINSRGYTISN